MLLLLAACAQDSSRLGTGLPGLDAAHAAMTGGAPEIALNICRQIATRNPADAEALACEGDALAALGNATAADTEYAAALALDPGSVAALLGSGRQRLADDPKRAEALFLAALKQKPHMAAALNDLGIARDLQGRHAEAQKAYGEAIGADPDMRAAQVNLGLSTALGGRPAEAARLLRPLGGGEDASTRERHDLAAVLAMSGRIPEARRLLSPELKGADLDTAITGYRKLLGR